MADNQESVDLNIPVLRREELIIILEELFKFSKELNNALQRKNDGLYVEDLSSHVEDNTKHLNAEQINLLDSLEIKKDGLYFNLNKLLDSISSQEGNAIEQKDDGLFVQDLSEVLNNHINNDNIHFTQEQIDNFNNMYQNTVETIDDFISSFTVNTWEFVTQLPEYDIKSNTLYILEIEDENHNKTYPKYIYLNNKFINIDDYVSSFDTHQHANKNTLDKFNEDQNGDLTYNNNPLISIQISDNENNALSLDENNKLYVPNLMNILEEFSKQTYMTKTVLLEQELTDINEYRLNADINDFNFLIINYYYIVEETDEETEEVTINKYDAKTEILDVDNLNYLYENHIDYLLEHDNGLSLYNSKVRFHDNKIQVTYYNNVCIYKIIGVN